MKSNVIRIKKPTILSMYRELVNSFDSGLITKEEFIEKLEGLIEIVEHNRKLKGEF